MNNCDKTNPSSVDIEKPNDQTVLIEKSKAMQEHILAFKAKMEYYRDNPDLKISELKQIDSTIMDWESTINYTYCYNYLELSDAISFDTVIELPIIYGDSITMANVTAKYYNDIIVAVQQRYFDAAFSDKKLMCVDLELTEGGDSLWVNTIIGNIHIVSHEPLLDWVYGKMEGTCDGQYVNESDAAHEIAENTRFYYGLLPPTGYMFRFYGVDTYYVLDPTTYLNPDDPDGENNYLDYLVYYANSQVVPPGINPDVECINSLNGELSFYKQSYIDLTQGWIDNSGGKKFIECSYVGREYTYPNNYIRHELETKIGYRYLVAIISIEDIKDY